MWIIAILIFGPVIYLIVGVIVDSISDKSSEIKRKKYYGEEKIIYFTTYNNDNISYEDIMLLFNVQSKKYRQRYFMIDYKIFNNKEEQNYAWLVKTTKETYGWGIIYNIVLHFTNGWVYLKFSNKQFFTGEKQAHEYYCIDGYDYGTVCIDDTLNNCREEAKIILKMNGREPTEYLPFNYIPLSDSIRSSSNNNKTKSQKKEEKSSGENKSHFDMLAFYRNLLGLKLRFSQDELKKSYREAVGKYHPDRYGSSSPRDRENAEMLMKQVNEAYEKLKVFIN